MWEEVATAGKEARRELVLTGKTTQERCKKSGLDTNIFKLTLLNFLEVSHAGLIELPSDISKLNNLTSLVLKANQLTCLPSISELVNMKLLDLSLNSLSSLPDMSTLVNLETLNLSHNKLDGDLGGNLQLCAKLAVLELTGNQLTSLGEIQKNKLEHLAVVLSNQNQLSSISPDIASNWPALKKFDLSGNKLSSVPGDLAGCTRLKELSLIENPLSDNRLKKMAAQKGTKSVLDYIRANCPKGQEGTETGSKGGKGKGKKGKAARGKSPEVEAVTDILSILSVSDKYPEILITDVAKEVRPYLVFCFVTGLDLTGENLRKFITLQTRLHKTVCDNRNIATIATHDLTKVVAPLQFTALPPGDLEIVPLSSPNLTKADTLVTNLKTEAEAAKKEKKRSQVSGLHQFLHLLDRWSLYPCLLDSGGSRVISFPPVTNSGDTKIGEETSSVLIEVTSSNKLSDCKNVLDTLLIELVPLQGGKLTVIQGRAVGKEGELRVTYPSKTDLTAISSITVIRE